MEILIRFIGIVTLACLGDDPSDACKGNIAMRAYLPDGSKGAIMCNQGIDAHQAYIRISQPHTPTNWTPEPCDPKPCSLYKLKGDEIFVDYFSKGGGVSNSGNRPRKISWRNYYPHIMLDQAIAESRSAAFMDLNAGTLEMITKKGMWVGHLTLGSIPENEVVIAARGKNGVTTKSIKVHKSTKITIDVVNLPPALAADHPIEPGEKHKHKPAKEHFYLHYLLARNPPTKDCKGPEPLLALESRAPDISCSNSGYP
ncbi:MAG TPA: hypothetical protein VMT00_17135 [Thermoanaerobaculia bacterium]|nr:hypothetical protein [Thermoanaerobaculia bacterium]